MDTYLIEPLIEAIPLIEFGSSLSPILNLALTYLSKYAR